MLELARTIIRNHTDSPQVFRLAFHSARVAGIAPHDQIRYASIVVDQFFFSHFAEGELIFRTGQNQQDQPVLQVAMEQTPHIFETIIPSPPPSADPADASIAIPALQQVTTATGAHTDRNSDIAQFTFAISHELKNSLTKLKLAVSLLETDDDPRAIQTHIGIIQRSSGQLEKTLNDLNEIIRIKHASPATTPVDFSSVFSNVYEELKDKILTTQARISTDFGGISDWMYVEVYLRNIFSNLLSNSLKYHYTNRRPDIVIKAIKDGNDVVLIFSDNGQGIDLERNKRNLFTPFAHFSSHRQEGKGLGLYIVKNMVEHNGGSIGVESRPGDGTTFRLLLPGY